MRHTISNTLLIASLLFLAGFLVSWILDARDLTGPLLTLFFVTLAISFYGHPYLKKFAYTVWIFAAVMTVTGSLVNDVVQPALAGGLPTLMSESGPTSGFCVGQ